MTHDEKMDVIPPSVLSKMAAEGEEALISRSNRYLSNEEDLEVLWYIDQEELSIFFILFCTCIV